MKVQQNKSINFKAQAPTVATLSERTRGGIPTMRNHRAPSVHPVEAKANMQIMIELVPEFKGLRPKEILVGVELNPGPEFDGLDVQFANLSLQNAKALRKPRNRRAADALSREITTAKRCAKRALKRMMKRNISGFEAQMFALPPLSFKLEDEQFSVLRELADRIAGVSDTWNEISGGKKDVDEVAKDAGKNLGSGAIEGAMEQLKNLARTFFEQVREKHGAKMLSICVVIAVTVIYTKCKSRSTFYYVCAALAVALVGYNYQALSKSIYDMISYLQNKEVGQEQYFDAAQAQMFDQTTLTDLVVMMLTWSTFPMLKSSHTSILRIIGDVGKNYSGVEGTVSFVVRILQKVLDFASQKMGFKSFTLMSTLVPKVDEWILETRNFLAEFGRGVLVHDQKTYDRVLNLEDRAYELLSLYARDKRNSNVGILIRPLSNELSKIRVLLQQEGVCQYKMRQAPLMISFAGVSQIGKSRMLRPFVAQLMSIVLPEEELKHLEEDFDAHVYSRQPEHEFWDGYCGQAVCFLDEKDLVKESLMTPQNANTDIIRMGNVFPNVLHMAGIEQKGNVHFRSKIVVCTTNVMRSSKGAESAVRHPEAVVNRFHFEVIVRVKKEFAIESDLVFEPNLWRLDKNKLPADGHFVPDIHEYVLLERRKDACKPHEVELVEGEVVSFDELLIRCAKKYKQLETEARAIPGDDKSAFAAGRELRAKMATAQMDDVPASRNFSDIAFMLDAGVDIDRIALESITMRSSSRACSDEDLRAMIEQNCNGLNTEQVGRIVSAVSGKVALEERELFKNLLEDSMDEVLQLGVRYSDLLEQRSYLRSRIQVVVKRAQRMIENCTGKVKELAMDVFTRVSWFFGEDWTLEKLKSVLDFAMRCCLELGKAYAAYRALSWLFSSKEETESVQKPTQVEAQMHDPALEDIATKIWTGNYYSIHFKGDSKAMGFGFFSFENTFNFCAHYVNTWKTRGYGDEVLELRGTNGYTIEVPVRTFFDFEKVGEDWCQGVISNSRRHADIRPLMCDTSVLKTRSKGSVMMIRPTKNGIERHYASFSVSYSTTYSDTVGKPYKLPVSLVYNIPTKVGECGLPLFIVDPTTRAKKLLGFHVAGSKGFGMCYLFPENTSEAGVAQGRYIPRTMVEIGSVPRFVGTSGQSAIRRSPLHGAWGPAMKQPARLSSFIGRDGEMIFPMERALMRYDQPILQYDETLVKACAHAAVVANTSTEAFSELPRKVTMEEAILGVPGMEFMESLNRSTSPGYPWNMNPRPDYKGKERFFGKLPEMTLDGPDWPQLHKEILEAEEMLMKGVRPEFYFTDSLKDELLKKSKVENGDTRLFCPSPIVYQVLFGIYFKDFLRKFMESRIQAEHAVGINVYSIEWDMLARKMKKHGEGAVVAGDFKNFDALESAQILREIGERVITCFADREYDSIRRLLWMEVWDSKHIVGRTIFQWRQSLPSGHPATTVVNCLFVSTVMRMCWVRANDSQISSLRSFEDNVALIAYGDDNILNISNHARAYFNQETITEHMTYFGLKYTPEDKETDVPLFRDLSEVEFLKRGFRYEPALGRYVAPLRLSSILEMPYWSKKEGFENIWRTNLDNAVRELALHEEKVFNEWCPQMVSAARRIGGYTPLIVDRSVLLDEISGMGNVYKSQLNDLAPSRSPTLNMTIDDHRELVSRGQKFRKSLTLENTAFDRMPWDIYPYMTKMGRVKQYLGHFRFGENGRVATSPRIGLAANNDNNNMITQLSEKNDMSGTTQVLNESGVKTVERASIMDVPQGLLSATRVGYSQSSIYDFLAKPVLLNTAMWNTQAAGNVILNKSLPADAFASAIYSNKLDGFLGFRGTTVIRLQVNGNKFQAGRLLLVFIPQGNVASSWPGSRLRSLKAATQLPRVELDLSTETEIIMEIPYISPTPFYNFNDATGPIGRAVVLCYSPLATGSGATEANISMWVHFKDVELTAPAVAQMADRRPKKISKKPNPSEQELNNSGDKPISSGLANLARAASNFARVPLLSNIAGPAA